MPMAGGLTMMPVTGEALSRLDPDTIGDGRIPASRASTRRSSRSGAIEGQIVTRLPMH
jgi:hypothetical protein